jgi:Tfp pilus assembly protein PilN
MIEINLLPKEFQVPERAPKGLLLVGVVGIAALIGLGVWGLSLNGDLENAKKDNVDKQSTLEGLNKLKTSIDEANAKIKAQRARQDAIITIAQSKVFWSEKLIEFSKILDDSPRNRFQGIWLEGLELRKGSSVGAGSGTLSMSLSVMGDNSDTIADFRQALQENANFWYPFVSIDSQILRITYLDGGGTLAGYPGKYKGKMMTTQLQIPVK